MALIKAIESKSEFKLKISSKVIHEIEQVREYAKQRNLIIDFDEALEQHLKKLIKKANEELTKNG